MAKRVLEVSSQVLTAATGQYGTPVHQRIDRVQRHPGENQDWHLASGTSTTR
ncbi:hypothetical protein [Amycolatopsis sp. 195334CR]|uniref:hypothetical protein n=1 Tax=Amycolatopsis sp. 195334CR TaxID=2814588 RepID=UPI001A8C3428|nr:hypothetical protein [Amycolatopsis sp. 195334CR]MBN6041142.1 hypothetical protein [Amycolatopsis sp. 195334CR]